MRKLLMLSVTLLLFMLGIFLGWNGGIRHAMEDSEMWIVEFDDPVTIHIDLDGNWYTHECYIG